MVEIMLVLFSLEGNPLLWGHCIMVNDGFTVGGLRDHGIGKPIVFSNGIICIEAYLKDV
jgi:hypothetical protein